MIRKFNETFTFGDLDEFDLQSYDEFESIYTSYYDFLNNNEVKKYFKKYISKHIKKFKKEFPIFEKIKIQIVEEISDDAIAMYIHESVLNFPIILISFNEVKDLVNDGFDLEEILSTTIYHELGHAMVDLDNQIEFIKDENLLIFDDEEDFVETFARDFFYNNKVDNQWYKFVKVVNSFEN